MGLLLAEINRVGVGTGLLMLVVGAALLVQGLWCWAFGYYPASLDERTHIVSRECDPKEFNSTMTLSLAGGGILLLAGVISLVMAWW